MVVILVSAVGHSLVELVVCSTPGRQVAVRSTAKGPLPQEGHVRGRKERKLFASTHDAVHVFVVILVSGRDATAVADPWTTKGDTGVNSSKDGQYEYE